MSDHSLASKHGTPRLLIRGGALFDGTGAPPMSDAAVLLDGGTIQYVGPTAGAPSVGLDARVIDAAGCTILPGLIDSHAHMLAYAFNMEARLTTHASLVTFRTMRNIETTLQAGFTTIRDAGGIDPGYRLAVEEGLIPGPRLLVSGLGLAPTGGLFDFHWGSGVRIDMSDMKTGVRQYVNGVENVREATRKLLLSGVDCIKIVSTGSIFARTGYPPAAQYSPAELEAIVWEAHAAGKKVLCHAEGGPGVMNALKAGVDSVEHGFYLDDDMIELMIANGTYLVPTLSAAAGVIEQARTDPNIHTWAVEHSRALIDDPNKGFLRALRAGVKIAMGSDIFGANHGDNAFELEVMVDSGMAPAGALLAATTSAADLLGIGHQTGSLTVGKLADVLLVDGDPLVDIRLLREPARIRMVVRGGTVARDLTAAPAMVTA
jgi:imidazolonepropionase-like amidohydrolase